MHGSRVRPVGNQTTADVFACCCGKGCFPRHVPASRTLLGCLVVDRLRPEEIWTYVGWMPAVDLGDQRNEVLRS